MVARITKKVGTLNDNSVSVSSNVKLVDFTTDGEYQTCTFKIMPNFWDGTGNTITFFVTPESQVVQTYEFYIKTHTLHRIRQGGVLGLKLKN